MNNERNENRTPNADQSNHNTENSHVIKISGKTSAKAAAGSLAMVLKDHGFAEMIAIGAGAVNQAVKAVIIARGHVAPLGQDIIIIPAFESIDIEGNEKTRIRFIIEPR